MGGIERHPQLRSLQWPMTAVETDERRAFCTGPVTLEHPRLLMPTSDRALPMDTARLSVIQQRSFNIVNHWRTALVPHKKTSPQNWLLSRNHPRRNICHREISVQNLREKNPGSIDRSGWPMHEINNYWRWSSASIAAASTITCSRLRIVMPTGLKRKLPWGMFCEGEYFWRRYLHSSLWVTQLIVPL